MINNTLPQQQVQQYQEVPVVDPITNQVIDYKLLPVPSQNQQYQSVPIYDQTTGQIIDHQIVPADLSNPQVRQRKNKKFKQVPVRDPQTGQITQQIVPADQQVFKKVKQIDPISGEVVDKIVPNNENLQVIDLSNQQQYQEVPVVDPITQQVIEYKVLPVPNQDIQYQSIPVYDQQTGQIIDHKLVPADNSNPQLRKKKNKKFKTVAIKDPQTGQIVDQQIVPVEEPYQPEFRQIKVVDPRSGQIVEKTVQLSIPGKQNNLPFGQQSQYQEVPVIDPITQKVIDYQIVEVPDGNIQYQSVPIIDQNTGQVIDHKLVPVDDQPSQMQLDQFNLQSDINGYQPTGTMSYQNNNQNYQQPVQYKSVKTVDPISGQIVEKTIPIQNPQLNQFSGSQYQNPQVYDQQNFGNQINPTVNPQNSYQNQKRQKEKQLNSQMAKQQQRVEKVQSIDPQTGRVVENVVPIINTSQLNNLPGEKQYQQVPVIDPVTQQVIDFQILPVPDTDQQYHSIPIIDQATGQIIDHKIMPIQDKKLAMQLAQNQQVEQIPIKDPQTGLIIDFQQVPKQQFIDNALIQQENIQNINGQLYKQVPLIDHSTGQVIDQQLVPLSSSEMQQQKQFKTVPIYDKFTGQIVDQQAVPINQPMKQELVQIRDPQTGQVIDQKVVEVPVQIPGSLGQQYFDGQSFNQPNSNMNQQQQPMSYQTITMQDPNTGEIIQRQVPVQNQAFDEDMFTEQQFYGGNQSLPQQQQRYNQFGSQNQIRQPNNNNNFQSQGTFGMENPFNQNSYGNQNLSDSMQFQGYKGELNQNQFGQNQRGYNQNMNEDQFQDFDNFNNEPYIGNQNLPQNFEQNQLSSHQSRTNSLSPNRFQEQVQFDQNQNVNPSLQGISSQNPRIQNFHDDLMNASPNTQQRMINQHKQQLREQQERILQNNPQLSRYQQHKEYLEDQYLNNSNQYTQINDQLNHQNMPGVMSDPTDIDGGDDMSSAQHSPKRDHIQENSGIPVYHQQNQPSNAFSSQRNSQMQNQSPEQQFDQRSNKPYGEEVFMDSLQPGYNPILKSDANQQMNSRSSSPNRLPNQNMMNNNNQINEQQLHGQNQQRAVSPYIDKDLPLIQEEDPDIDNCESDINDRDLISTPGQKSNFKSQSLNSNNPVNNNLRNLRPPTAGLNNFDRGLDINEAMNQNNPIPFSQNTQQNSGLQSQMPQNSVQGVNLKDAQRKIIVAPNKLDNQTSTQGQNLNTGNNQQMINPTQMLGNKNQQVIPGINNPIKSINNPSFLANQSLTGRDQGAQQNPHGINSLIRPGQNNAINSQQQPLGQANNISNVPQNQNQSSLKQQPQQNQLGNLQLKKELNPSQNLGQNISTPQIIGQSRNPQIGQISNTVPNLTSNPLNNLHTQGLLPNAQLIGDKNSLIGQVQPNLSGINIPNSLTTQGLNQSLLKQQPKTLPPIESLKTNPIAQLAGLNSQTPKAGNSILPNQSLLNNPNQINTNQPSAHINPLLNRAQSSSLIGQQNLANLGKQLPQQTASGNGISTNQPLIGGQPHGNPILQGNQVNPNVSQQNLAQRPSSLGIPNKTGNQVPINQNNPLNLLNQRSGSLAPQLSGQQQTLGLNTNQNANAIPNLKAGQQIQNQQQQQNMKPLTGYNLTSNLQQPTNQLPSLYSAPGQLQRGSLPGSQQHSMLMNQQNSMISQGAPGPNGRIPIQNPMVQQQPTGLQTASSGLPSQAAQLITQQIMMMQKQMEQGFSKMCDKIEDIEGRVDNASNQLQMFERQQQENLRMQEQKNLKYQQKFRKLSDTLTSQQQLLKDQQFARTDGDDQREPRFRDQAAFANQTGQKSPQRSQQSKLSVIWNKVLDLVKKKQYEDAYRLTMKEADDIYLIRLVAQTGPVVKQLEDKTAFQVINRINKIIRSGAFEAMEIEWIEDANKRGLFQQMSKHEQNEYLDTLFWFSQSKLNPKISERAQDVYQQIKSTAATAKGLSTKDQSKRMQ